jgi:hypothetical protein
MAANRDFLMAVDTIGPNQESAVIVVGIDSAVAGERRPYLGDSRLGAVESTRALGPAQPLLPRCGVEIGPKGHHVDGKGPEGLCTIDDHEDAPLVRLNDDLRDRQHLAGRVGDM